jgi:hypothetical protein
MDVLTGLGGPTFDTSFGITLIFQILYFVLLTGYVLYAFLLTLRIRILSETVEVGSSKAIMAVVYVHLVVAIIGSFLAFLIALLA